MASALPGARLRPHVKAHKCTPWRYARPRSVIPAFTCATISRDGGHGPGRAGRRPPAGERGDRRHATRCAGASGCPGHGRRRLGRDDRRPQPGPGCPRCSIDVNVGCPVAAADPRTRAAWPTAPGRRAVVRGVMGYEGHVVGLEDRADEERCSRGPWRSWCVAHNEVGGEIDLRRRHGHLRPQQLGHRDPGRLVRADGHGLRQARPALRPGAQRARHGRSRSPGTGRWPTAASRRSAWTTATPPSTGADVWFCSDEH